MKKYYEIKGRGEAVRIERVTYANNDTLAIALVTSTGEPYCNLTVNLPDSLIWGDERTAFVDTNNCPWAEEFIKENNLGVPMNYIARSGFCTYPLYRFNIENM